jgi:hypothetical protein
LHPLESAAFSRRTQIAVITPQLGERVKSIRSRPSISDPKRRFGFHRKFRASAGVCHVNDRRLAAILAIEADARPDVNGGYLKAMRGPGESYSEVITRLANVTGS